jgi:hypothetical protein
MPERPAVFYMATKIKVKDHRNVSKVFPIIRELSETVGRVTAH